MLSVTLVTGLRDSSKARVVRTLGTPTADDGPRDWPLDDAADFALELADRIRALADDGQNGSMVVELAAEADIVEVALVLRHVFAETPAIVALRDVVAVADARDLRALLFREGPAAADLGRAERLALLLEFATAIVIVGADGDGARELVGLAQKLNPGAALLALGADERMRRLSRSRGRASIDGLGRGLGWMLELSGAAGLPTTSHGVGCLVYRDPRPFHPARLAAVVESWLEPEDAGLILRSRGLVRLATRADRVGSWSTAGAVLALDPTAMTSWDADSPSGQELVFFGLDLNRDHIVRALDSCLLDSAELIAGPMEWETYYDPFPVWDLKHDH
jgi:G3E family GTPase